MNTTNLTGSEKQIAWATEIRSGYIATVEAALAWTNSDAYLRYAGSDEFRPAIVASLTRALETLAAATDSRVFIDSRRGGLSKALTGLGWSRDDASQAASDATIPGGMRA